MEGTRAHLGQRLPNVGRVWDTGRGIISATAHPNSVSMPRRNVMTTKLAHPAGLFFYSNEALPDHRLRWPNSATDSDPSGRSPVSKGTPAESFSATPGWRFRSRIRRPVIHPPGTKPGPVSWSAANFKGPMAYYVPETWSKIGSCFTIPSLYGRGLDARPGVMGGEQWRSIPSRASSPGILGDHFSKIPRLQFPVDSEGRAVWCRMSPTTPKAALFDAFRSGEPEAPRAPVAWTPKAPGSPADHPHHPVRPGGKTLAGVERIFDTGV